MGKHRIVKSWAHFQKREVILTSGRTGHVKLSVVVHISD